MSDVLSRDLILENKTIFVTKPCTVQYKCKYSISGNHNSVMLVGIVAQVRSDTTRNKKAICKNVAAARTNVIRDKTLALAKLMRGKSSKVGKGRGVVVILRTTVDAALNLCGTES